MLDAADQTIFQAFGFDPPGYQSYDKAMDIFYLSIAYLAAMRNWDNLPPSRSRGSSSTTGWSARSSSR